MCVVSVYIQSIYIYTHINLSFSIAMFNYQRDPEGIYLDHLVMSHFFQTPGGVLGKTNSTDVHQCSILLSFLNGAMQTTLT